MAGKKIRGSRRVAVDANVSQETAQALIDKVTEVLLKNEVTLTPRGTVLAHVQLFDDNWRQKAVEPQIELMFRGIRVGQRSAFIFTFEPAGGHPEYKLIEWGEDKIFSAVPQFEQMLIEALGFYEDEEASIDDVDEEGNLIPAAPKSSPQTWLRAKGQFLNDYERLAKVERKKQAEATKLKEMNDPQWGIF